MSFDPAGKSQGRPENSPHWIPRDISAFWKTDLATDAAICAIVAALVLLVRAVG